jgi:hypothetical protein
MDRDTILQQLEQHEIKILMKLNKPAKEAMNEVVDRWLAAIGILNELYNAHKDPSERKVLDLLLTQGLTLRNEDLKKEGYCIVRLDSLLAVQNPKPPDVNETSESVEETKEDTAEETGESSIEMWKRVKSDLFDEEQLDSCEWMPIDTLEVAEMVCLCENYFRTQFSRHMHTSGTLESLRIPMKDYFTYVRDNAKKLENYPEHWVRQLINQLVSEAWIFGKESDHADWTMKPFSKGCIDFPKDQDEHPAVMQKGSIDLMQYCKTEEQ